MLVSLDITSSPLNVLIKNEPFCNGIFSILNNPTLIGVIIGSIITFGSQYYLERRKRIIEEKKVKAAFFSEINAVLRLIEFRKMLLIFEETLDFIYDNDNYPAFDNLLKITKDEYFLVYKTHIHSIGLMTPELAAKITDFYNCAFSILEVVTTVPYETLKSAHRESEFTGVDYRYIYLLNLTKIMKVNWILCYEMIKNGKEICQSLSTELNIKYIPVFANLESKEEIEHYMKTKYPSFKIHWEKHQAAEEEKCAPKNNKEQY